MTLVPRLAASSERAIRIGIVRKPTAALGSVFIEECSAGGAIKIIGDAQRDCFRLLSARIDGDVTGERQRAKRDRDQKQSHEKILPIGPTGPEGAVVSK